MYCRATTIIGLPMPLYPKLPGFLPKDVMKKVPRDFKAEIKKIPAGPYCYGSFLGSKSKRENGKLVASKGGTCPYWHSVNEGEDPSAFCSLTKCTDDVLLADSIKVCDNYDILFDYGTGRIIINGNDAKCLLINELPKEQQEPFRMWLNGNTASVPTIGTFATKSHYEYWIINVWNEIMRLQKIRESKEAL